MGLSKSTCHHFSDKNEKKSPHLYRAALTCFKDEDCHFLLLHYNILRSSFKRSHKNIHKHAHTNSLHQTKSSHINIVYNIEIWQSLIEIERICYIMQKSKTSKRLMEITTWNVERKVNNNSIIFSFNMSKKHLKLWVYG